MPSGLRSVLSAALPPRWPATPSPPRRNEPNLPCSFAPPATSCPPERGAEAGARDWPEERLLRGPPEQAVGGSEIGHDLSGRALAGERGGALAGVDAGDVVIAAADGRRNLGLGRRVGLEVLLVAGPVVEEPVAQRAAA